MRRRAHLVLPGQRLWQSFLSNLSILLLLSSFFHCVYASSPLYVLENVHQTPSGITGTLKLESGSGPYGDDLAVLSLSIEYQRENRVRIRIYDPSSRRWEVPDVIVDSPREPPLNVNFHVELSYSPFGFAIRRKSDNLLVFDTRGQPFVFENHYMQFGTKLTSDNPNIYGLGERVHNFRLDPQQKVYTMFSADHGTAKNMNLYGVHPIYMEYNRPSAHGVFLLNSNAMDVAIDNSTLTYKLIGGIIDLYVFMGSSPEEVVQQYTQLVGRPYLPPFWALGWHQCRWGYETIEDVANVVDAYAKSKIPLEVMWNDIDYMDQYLDFTYDPKRYPLEKVKKFVDSLHANHQKYVTIIDPGIHNVAGYEPYEQGLRENVFITTEGSTTPIVNLVWPGTTVFPDFTNPSARAYWVSEIKTFHEEKAEIDGVWIDMNEVVGFVDAQYPPSVPHKRPGFDPNFPPYVPGGHPLYERTLNLSANSYLSNQFDVHSMYGYFEAKATHEALVSTRGTRPLVIGRSTFAGQSKYGYHWLGDNDSTYDSMFMSISGILSFNLFGIPLVGADICGFNGNTTKELCARWTQLGAFYPFARNHNSIGSSPQEPYVFGEDFVELTRNALLNRYRLLPYYYTLFYHANVDGSTVARPLFFEFPADSEPTLPYLDREFMIGAALLIAPVLDEGATSVSAYLPGNTRWFDYYSGADLSSLSGKYSTFSAPVDHINVFSRGGTIIPIQDPGMTTTATRQNPFGMIVSLDMKGSASGDVYFDDGESLDSIPSKKYSSLNFLAFMPNSMTTMITSHIAHAGFDSQVQYGTIVIYGLLHEVNHVTFNGDRCEFTFDASTMVVVIQAPVGKFVTLDMQIILNASSNVRLQSV